MPNAIIVDNLFSIVKMSLKFVLSQKGKPLLTHNGHVYSTHYKSSKGISWRCVEYNTRFSCHATIKTSSAHRKGNWKHDYIIYHNLI